MEGRRSPSDAAGTRQNGCGQEQRHPRVRLPLGKLREGRQGHKARPEIAELAGTIWIRVLGRTSSRVINLE
jgi:hypothetical protein